MSQGFAIRPDHGEDHLAARNERGDTPFAVDTEDRIFPTEVRARFADLAGAMWRVNVGVRFSREAVLTLRIAHGHPVGVHAGVAIRIHIKPYQDMAAIALRRPVGVAGIALHLFYVL